MKAPRDMTRAQFAAALKRNGLKQQLLWLHDAETSISFGLVMRTNGKIMRRASLAKALQGRAAELAARAKKCA